MPSCLLNKDLGRVGFLLLLVWLISLSVAFLSTNNPIVFLVFITIAAFLGFTLLYYQNKREKRLKLKFAMEPSFDKVEFIIFIIGLNLAISQFITVFKFPFPYALYSLVIFVLSLIITIPAIIIHRNKRLKKNPAIV